MSYAQPESVRGDDARAFEIGQRNGSTGRLVYDDLAHRCARPDNLAKALCVAGFESARIAKGIGRYPIHLYAGRRHYWLVAPGTFQATHDRTPPAGAAGYANLRALWRLKGESIR